MYQLNNQRLKTQRLVCNLTVPSRFVSNLTWGSASQVGAVMQYCTLEDILNGTHRMQLLLHQRVQLAIECCQALVYMQGKVWPDTKPHCVTTTTCKCANLLMLAVHVLFTKHVTLHMKHGGHGCNSTCLKNCDHRVMT